MRVSGTGKGEEREKGARAYSKAYFVSFHLEFAGVGPVGNRVVDPIDELSEKHPVSKRTGKHEKERGEMDHGCAVRHPVHQAADESAEHDEQVITVRRTEGRRA